MGGPRQRQGFVSAIFQVSHPYERERNSITRDCVAELSS